ncbi:MAG: AAA family ATPase [Candidatus Bipolaricaulota bacterium]|nr:AAA family ATPase [Candidatus Bipolaricaulota bacterium]MDW8031267.1 AAA family ATPase [Candidatus Bipolaricaulota bacterium]
MKIAISGKGGVGKTTLCALLAREAASQGKRVFAVDADPNPTLALMLGFPEGIIPLVELQELIEERLGSPEGFLKLNPKVDDIPERFAVERDGIKLLVMGPIRQGGGGCACPQNTFLKSLLQHLVLERDELILLDFEAGLEPLGRATAQGVDALLIVVEPDRASVVTARRISTLAQQIGVKRIYAVANKIREPGELHAIQENVEEIEVIGALPYSERLRVAGPTADPGIRHHVQAILESIMRPQPLSP